MTASERQKKTKEYVRKGKGKATPTELASLVRDSSPYTPDYSPSQTQTKLQAEEVVPEALVQRSECVAIGSPNIRQWSDECIGMFSKSEER
ncbi:hypothetical protein LguiA_025348 [Lonicera macranthoides]